MTKQTVENLELGLKITRKKLKKLVERNKEIANILTENKKPTQVEALQKAITSAIKVRVRLQTVLAKPTTEKILKKNKKAFLKQVPSIPNVKNFNSTVTNVTNYKKVSGYVVNVLKKEFQINEIMKTDLKQKVTNAYDVLFKAKNTKTKTKTSKSKVETKVSVTAKKAVKV